MCVKEGKAVHVFDVTNEFAEAVEAVKSSETAESASGIVMRRIVDELWDMYALKGEVIPNFDLSIVHAENEDEAIRTAERRS